MRGTPVRGAPVLLALLALPALAQDQKEQRAREDGLRRFAASLSAYLEARSSGADPDEARADVERGLGELSRLLGGDALQRPAELGRALLLARAHDAPAERAGKVATGTFTRGSFAGAGMAYAYRLPKDYDPARAYPLILALPGEEETPADHIRVNWTLREIQERAIVLSPAMPARREDWERVMVHGRPGGLCHVLAGLRAAEERFTVDEDRVFVAGRGKAVPAALAAGNYSPQRFAGVIGRAGDASELRPDNLGNLPTFFAGGGTNARAFGETAKAAGSDTSTFQVDANEQDVWTWMTAHPRRTFPEQVVLAPGDPYPIRAYWLAVNPSAPECRATAGLDRAMNTIRIEAVGMAQVTVFLSDAMLDLSRPVKVFCNGVEQGGTVARSLAGFLELALDGTSDSAAVYVARVDCDLTGGPAAAAEAAAPDEELEQRLTAAGSDVAKLWDLHVWCASTKREPADERVLRAVVRLDPRHAQARAALGHVSAAGQWFTSADALARFQASQDPRAAAERGLVEFKALWMHRDERALAVKGWVKDQETGQWLAPADMKRLAEGWARQDLAWIPPQEAAHVDAGLWRVDGEWLDLAHADRRHASLDSPWRIPGAEIQLYTTCERALALRAQQEMARALADLRHVFGAEPVLPLRVAMLRDEEQYDRFAFGDPDGRRLPVHAGRLQAVHSAYFAESWFERAGGKRAFLGMGVCCWDTHVPNGDLYGRHAARLATGLSYVDALDPSPDAVRKALSAGPGPEHYAAYQAEKALPAWLRWGGAVYAERYFRDVSVGLDGDPWWARKWSLDNLRQRGGLRPLAEVLAFPLDPDRRDDGFKLLIEAGLVVSFVADGECAPVAAAHAALKKSLAAGRIEAKDVKALADAVLTHEAELRTFAGL